MVVSRTFLLFPSENFGRPIQLSAITTQFYFSQHSRKFLRQHPQRKGVILLLSSLQLRKKELSQGDFFVFLQRGEFGRLDMPTGRINAFLGISSALSAYTAKVIYDQTEHKSFLEASENEHKLKFSPGSADELLQDSLKTGDLLLFSRRWYRYHLPEALSIKLYQTFLNTDYDHVGVIICDKYGEPSVLEKTYWGGYKLRPFSERIAYSRSHQISLLMLNPRDAALPAPEPKHTMGRPRAPRSTIASSEVRNEKLRADIQSLVNTGTIDPLDGGKVESTTAADVLAGNTIIDCANVRLVRSVYRRMGLELKLSSTDSSENPKSFEQVISCRHLLAPQSTGLSLVDTDAEDSAEKRCFSDEIVLVRDS